MAKSRRPAPATTPPNLLDGLVVSAHGRHCVVESDDGSRRICHPRGKKNTVVVGDQVRWSAQPPGQGEEGSIEQVQPRRPWVHQPDCLHCHADFQPPATDATFNLWTTGADDLFRARTDDSGRLFCAACHSSAHAVHPAVNPYGSHLDALQPLQYQTNRLPLGANRNCALCHTVAMEDEMHHPNMLRDFRNE